jgi:WD40 repeat protein
MGKQIRPSLRGRWTAGCLLAAGSVLVPLIIRPSPDNPEQPPGIILGSHHHPVRSVAFAPDGKTLASGGGWPHLPGEIKLWDLTTRTERVALTDRHGVVYSLAFAPDGQALATAGLGASVRFWDAATGGERAGVQSPLPSDSAVQIAFSPDGRMLALGGWHHDVTLRHLATGAERVLGKGGGPVTFDPDGRRLAGTHWDAPSGCGFVAVVRVWDVTTGRELITLRGHEFGIWTLCFSPDGQVLASGSHDGTVRLSDATTGQTRAILRGHEGSVNAVAFSPDSRVLASGGHDRTVRLWNALTGQERAVLQGHTGAVTTVAFSPDGRQVASGSCDMTVRLWPAGPSPVPPVMAVSSQD